MLAPPTALEGVVLNWLLPVARLTRGFKLCFQHSAQPVWWQPWTLNLNQLAHLASAGLVPQHPAEMEALAVRHIRCVLLVSWSPWLGDKLRGLTLASLG